ncbi:MAG: tetratricopeptide repeat protein [Pseudomonadota bacterium]
MIGEYRYKPSVASATLIACHCRGGLAGLGLTLVLLAVLTLGALPAIAQSTTDEGRAAEEGANEESATGEAPPPSAPLTEQPAEPVAETSDLHLDALFEQLARKQNPNWQNIQNQIWATWSRSGSDSMDLLLSRAVRAMEAEEYDTALLHLNDLTRLAPDFAEGWNKRATVYFLQKRYGPSVADIQRVLAIEPRHFGALSGLGIILDRTGDKAGALVAYRRVIELHPNMEAAQTAIDRLAPEVDGREL